MVKGKRDGNKILNYSTEISVDKSIAEIEHLLQMAGANCIMKEMTPSGVTGLSFTKKVDDTREIMYRVPMNAQSVMVILNEQVEQGLLSRWYANNTEQARRVGWRIVKGWIENNLAYTQTRFVKFEQVFLSYAVGKNGMTLYEMMSGEGFRPLLTSGDDKK